MPIGTWFSAGLWICLSHSSTNCWSSSPSVSPALSIGSVFAYFLIILFNALLWLFVYLHTFPTRVFSHIPQCILPVYPCVFSSWLLCAYCVFCRESRAVTKWAPRPYRNLSRPNISWRRPCWEEWELVGKWWNGLEVMYFLALSGIKPVIGFLTFKCRMFQRFTHKLPLKIVNTQILEILWLFL